MEQSHHLFIIPKKKEINSTLNIKDQNFTEALTEAFSHKGYVLLVLGFFVCGFQITLVGTHVPGYMQDRGLGGWSATIILSLIGLFNIVGTLGMGYLGTKYSKKKLIKYFIRTQSNSNMYLYFFTSINLYGYIFWMHFGVLWLINRTSNQRNSCSNIWNKIFKLTFWNSFFKSSIRCFCRSVFRRLLF